MLLSAGEGLTQIAYISPTLTLSRDLVSHPSAIPFAGEGIVLPGLLFPRRYCAWTTLPKSIINYKILSLTLWAKRLTYTSHNHQTELIDQHLKHTLQNVLY